ncbi:hypothetical protein [Scytonema hofmannii]|nr:hypothetical protein [Scytonema hofmannii]
MQNKTKYEENMVVTLWDGRPRPSYASGGRGRAMLVAGEDALC